MYTLGHSESVSMLSRGIVGMTSPEPGFVGVLEEVTAASMECLSPSSLGHSHSEKAQLLF